MKNLYIKTVEAMDKYNKALAMGFPESFLNELDETISAFLEFIEANGKMNEFRDFAGIV